MIGHGWLLRAFSFARPKGVLGMSSGVTPRHAQTARDLGFAMQFNAETPHVAFRTAQLSSSRIVPRVTIARVTLFIPLERPHVNYAG